VEELKHHRGITHTFIAIPVVAAVIVGLVWLLHRWNERRRLRKLGALHAGPGEPIPLRLQPRNVHWGWLYLTCFIAASTHIALDWTNNYGVRPMFPFNPRWYAGSFMFIAEPVLWGLFLLALVLPWLLGLADREMGVRRTRFRGRGWAIFALAGMAALGIWRWTEHTQAQAMLENTQVTSAPVTRIGVQPYPINPFRWHAILETQSFFQTAEVNTQTGAIDSDPQTDVLYKPDDTPAIEAAKRNSGPGCTWIGAVGVVRDVGQQPVGRGAAAIRCRDAPDHRRIHRPALRVCVHPTRAGAAAGGAERLGLHRRRTRRSGRGHERPRAEVGLQGLRD
jgi:inner membrane protein